MISLKEKHAHCKYLMIPQFHWALYLRTLELRILFMTNSIYLHFDEDTDKEDFEH